jgi:AraC family transcriptional regulator
VVSEIVHASARQLPCHSHEAAYFSMLLSGRYAEQVGQRTHESRPFAVTFHPPNFSHRDRIGEAGARFFNVDVEPSWIASRGIDLTNVPPGLLADDASVLAARAYAQHRAGALGTTVVESFVWELIGDATRVRAVPERRQPRWMKECLQLLHGSLGRRVTIAEVARTVDIHPVHLSREFRRRFGRTVGEHLQVLRVRAACALLGDPGRSLADIAAATGFADQSHFTRVFHTLVGCSPGRYRSILVS